MSSKLEICNEALVLLGEMPINDINGTDAKAVKARALWDITRDELLRMHEWSFATRRVQLQLDAATPSHGFDYAYPLPSDCLRVLSVTEGEDETQDMSTDRLFYKIEYGEVLTSVEGPYLRYISRVEETGRFDSSFSGCMASRLAMKLGLALTKSPQIVQAMAQLAQQRLYEARSVDNRESGISTFKRHSWEDAR